MNCKCGAEMKPLFTGFYCPRECDRPVERAQSKLTVAQEYPDFVGAGMVWSCRRVKSGYVRKPEERIWNIHGPGDEDLQRLYSEWGHGSHLEPGHDMTDTAFGDAWIFTRVR